MSKAKPDPLAKFLVALTGCAGLLMFLTGCAIPRPDGGLEPGFALRGAQADLAYGPAALDRAVAGFMAPSGTKATSGGLFPSSGSGGGGSTRPRLRVDLDYSALEGRDRALELGAVQRFTQGWQAQYALRAGQGVARYLIPAGQLRVPLGNIAVIIDEPIALKVNARFLEAEALALRDMHTPFPGQITLGAGTGLRVTQSRLRVTSGLLAIDSRHRQSQPYAVVQARYRPPHVPARAFFEGRAYGRNTAGMRAGVDLVWP